MTERSGRCSCGCGRPAYEQPYSDYCDRKPIPPEPEETKCDNCGEELELVEGVCVECHSLAHGAGEHFKGCSECEKAIMYMTFLTKTRQLGMMKKS